MDSARVRLTAVESVRCLGCGTIYTRPTGRGSLAAHDGCPECTYVGWQPSGERFTAPSPHARFGADRPRRRQLRSG